MAHEVAMVFCFPDDETMMEVLSIFMMHEQVARSDMFSELDVEHEYAEAPRTEGKWIRIRGDGYTYLRYTDSEDSRLRTDLYYYFDDICTTFAKERSDFHYASKMMRLGEVIVDYEYENNASHRIRQEDAHVGETLYDIADSLISIKATILF